MDIWHRITYHRLDAVDHILDELGIRYRKSPLPRESYILRAYPNNPAARRAMRAQAKCRKAM
jgi:hypothetical protein